MPLPRSVAAITLGVLTTSLLAPLGAREPAGATTSARATTCAAWMDPRDSADERADALVAAMSTDQKMHMVTFGTTPPYLLYYGTAGHVDGIPELCIPDLVLSDAGSGVAGLQIATTTFPSGIAQASTWNPRLQHQIGSVIGDEAHRKGINVMLGPGMNIARTPYNGRNFEYFGEDPYLTSQMVVPFIRGIQSHPVIADAKHYLLNDQEIDRNTVDAVASERTEREIYLPPFEAAVKDGDVGSIMCSYNLVDDRHVCQNRRLLTDILRKDWGFDGFVVSDWGAVHSVAPTANAGMDLEMFAANFPVPQTPVTGASQGQYFTPANLTSALDAGQLTMRRLDDMVRNIVRPMFERGLFDDPVQPGFAPFLSDVSTHAHRATAAQVASEATVLLKNRGRILPLNHRGGRTIAVIGYAANPVGAASSTGGGGSSHGSGLPPRVVSPLQGITQQASQYGDRVVYAEGSAIADAVAAASVADVVVVVAADGSSEGSDRSDLSMNPGACVTLLCFDLPVDQEQLVSAVTAANPKTIVVLDTGGPVRMPWLTDAAAVLVPWFGGIEHGTSVGRILYGDDEPSGRLPQTFPRSEKQNAMPARQYPGVGGKVTYSEGLFVGYRWYDQHRVKPLFPFGFGLGYSTFAYRDLEVERSRTGAVVRFTVRNTGTRTGSAVPQVYVSSPPSAHEPPRQLKGFTKVRLRPGQSRVVTIRLDRRAFAQWSVRRHGWVVTPGRYGVLVGSNSRDLPLRSGLSMGR